MNTKKKDIFAELPTLFFTTRQIIRSKLPKDGHSDPNAWLRFETLRFIAESKRSTMQDVAHHLRIKAPSATSLVGNLVRRSLIVRGGSVDKRVVSLSLTKAGMRQLDRYKARARSAVRAVFSKLSDREVNDLVAILRRVQKIHG